MGTMLKDLRFAIRTLLRQRAFTVVAVITLALGIGANTAIFSVVNGVLLQALPFKDPDRLVSLNKVQGTEGFPGIAAFEYLAWSDHGGNVAAVAAYSNENFNLTGQGEPERISGASVSGNFFEVLGVAPQRGRTFLLEEDQPGRERVVVVGENFWKRQLKSSEQIIGTTLTLDDKPYTVIGVMPRAFRFPNEFDVWVPMALDRAKETKGDLFTLVDVIGRLNPGINASQAQAELNRLSTQTAAQMKEKVAPLEVVPLHHQLVAGVKRTVLVLWGAVALVMFLACANVASLMLSRTVGRQREMSVRAAVGASRWQLVRQLLIESVVLGLAGGAFGVLIAVWSKGVIASLVPEGVTSAVHDLNMIRMDWRVFVFTLGLSILTGVIFGLAPAVTASKPDLVKTLRENKSSSVAGFGLRSIRGWLVVTELALAMVLLLAAGLLVRSFNQLMAIDLGFNRQNVLSFRVALPRSKYPESFQTINFHTQLIDRLKTIPGVVSVGTTSHQPLSGFSIIAYTGVENNGPPNREKDKPLGFGAVSPEYFNTMKIPLLSGRTYDDRDNADSPKVAVVNQAFARRYFPNGNVLGKRIGFGCKGGDLCRTIVGVVGNVRQESITDDVAPEGFLPFGQMAMNGMTVLMRTKGDPSSFVPSVRAAVTSLDPNQPIHEVKTLEQRVDESVAVTRSLMFLFGTFAALALVLASVGIYGIVSYSVTQRTHEIGIRMALGAQRAHVLKLIMRNGITLAMTGIVLGVGGALALTRFLKTLLFGVQPTDSRTFVVISIGLLLVALAACLIPARRATKVDPLEALRYE
jgi:putative ABC transport system permease protein